MCKFINQYSVLAEGTSMSSGVLGVNRYISQYVLTAVID